MLDLLDLLHFPVLLGDDCVLPVLGSGGVLHVSIVGRDDEAIQPLLLLRLELFLLLVSGEVVSTLSGVLVLVLDLPSLPDPRLDF